MKGGIWRVVRTVVKHNEQTISEFISNKIPYYNKSKKLGYTNVD